MNDADPAGLARSRSEDDATPKKGLHQKVVEALLSLMPWRLARRLNRIEALVEHHDRLTAEIGKIETAAHESRVQVDTRFDAVEEHVRSVHTELGDVEKEIASLREERLLAIERRLDEVEARLAEVRDSMVPAAVGRMDALVDRLARELEELGSLVERMIAREPLPVPLHDAAEEQELAQALSQAHSDLFRELRGSEDEIAERLQPYLKELSQAGSVLDLGCGRGEFLDLLRSSGVKSRGVEFDQALAGAARRRGLDVVEGDLLEVMQAEADESWAAITAMHVFEHLSAAQLIRTLEQARRVLVPGGLLLIESPNPETLRVGASEFWLDPTHLRPLPPDTMRLFLVAAGFEIERIELLHPFPADQHLVSFLASETEGEHEDLEARLRDLVERIDELLNGPRDFSIRARKPIDQGRSSHE